MSQNYQVLLFYCYSKIKDPIKFRRDHLRFCIENNIVGRIIISDEGINGTISGKEIDCKNYIDEIKRQKTLMISILKLIQLIGMFLKKLMLG